MGLTVLAFGAACSCFPEFDDGGGGGQSGTGTDGGSDSGDPSAGSATNATASDSGDSAGTSAGNEDCYEDTTVGCTEVTWATIVETIDLLYLLQDTYYGYDKQEALDVARAVYDNGVYPQSYLSIVSAYPIEAGFRVHIVVTDPDGFPVTDLAPADFELVVDGGDPADPESLTELEDVDPAQTDLDLDFSIVIDDSGSVADCDANFVAQGLAFLFDNIPAVYQASLVKFASEVFVAQERTDDPSALVQAVLGFCTDRGSTALWDAISIGTNDLPHQDGFEAVVVFTDGLDNNSSTTLSEVVSEANATSTPVLVLGLGLPDIFALLELADGTSGAFVYVNSGQRVLEGFETLTDFVRHSYVIDLPAEPASLEVRATLPSGVVADTL
jgi:hypothetical protein